MNIEILYYYVIYFSSKDNKDNRWNWTSAEDPKIIRRSTKLTSEEFENIIKDLEEKYTEKHKNREIVRIVAKVGIEITGLYKTTKGKKAKEVIHNDKYYCYKKWKLLDDILKYSPDDIDEKELLMQAKIRRMEQKLKKESNNYEI